MSEFSDMLADSSDEAASEFREAVTFRGMPSQANVGTLAENPEFMMGGESPRKSCTIILPFPDPLLEPAPRKGERIATTRHGSLEIASIAFDTTDYVLTCTEVAAKK